MNTFERHEPQNPTPRATEPPKVYYDRDADRIELLWIDRPSRDVYGEHTKVASLTTYCAGLEPVTVELARDAAQALGKALIEAWIGATP